MAQKFDAIIIGAGIMGCATAYELSKRGFKVVLLEKYTLGVTSSGKSSAIIRQHYSNTLTARMALHSLRVFRDFDDQVGGECGFTPSGFIAVVDAKDQAGLEENVKLQKSLGINTEIISVESLKDLMPSLETADLVSAVYEPESGYADPYLTVTSYASAAKREGTRLFLETPVTGIRLEGGKVVGVNTDHDRLDSPLIINCTGAWGAQVAKMAGIDVPISSCRVQVAFFRRPPGHEEPHPVFADFIRATYFRSETGGLTLVGLIDPKEADAVVNPDRFHEGVDDSFVMDAGERLISRYPAMEQSQVTGGYAALYAITPDWHPIIDELIPDSGLYICAGFSGHGFKLGPAVSVMTADMVTQSSSPIFDPHLFRLNRYEENESVRGQYEYSIVG